MANKTVEQLIAMSMFLEESLLSHPKLSKKDAFEISVYSIFIVSQCYIRHVYTANRSGEIRYRPEIMADNIAEMISFATNYCSQKDQRLFSFKKAERVINRLDAYKPHTGKYYVLTTELNKYISSKLDPLDKTEFASKVETFSTYTLMLLQDQLTNESYDDISDMEMPGKSQLRDPSNSKTDIKYPGKGGFQPSGAHISLAPENDEPKGLKPLDPSLKLQ